MKVFSSRQEVLDTIRAIGNGEERRKLLKNSNAQDILHSTGAGVLFYCGDSIDNTAVLLLERRCIKTGNPDGIGLLGGLGDYIDKEAFEAMEEAQRLAVIGKKDNVILQDGKAVLTNDIPAICLNNIRRETAEELADVGITGFTFPDGDMQLVLTSVDYSYICDIWDGKEWVVIPTGYCYTMRVDESLIDMLHTKSRANPRRLPESEGINVTKMPLKEALLMDGAHGFTENFRYPHEYKTVQILAELLKAK